MSLFEDLCNPLSSIIVFLLPTKENLFLFVSMN